VTAPAPRIPTTPEEFPDTGPHALGGIGQRAVAKAIDLGLVIIPSIVAAFAYVDVSGDEVKLDDIPLWVLALPAVVAIMYETTAVAFTGRTVGKWIMGLRVADYANGAKPGWSASAQRTLLPNVFAVVPVAFISLLQWAVYGTSLGHPLRRGFHDRYAGTIIVRAR